MRTASWRLPGALALALAALFYAYTMGASLWGAPVASMLERDQPAQPCIRLEDKAPVRVVGEVLDSEASSRREPSTPDGLWREWSRPLFFHTTNGGLRIDGPIMSNVRSRFFNLEDRATWTPDPDNDCGSFCRLHIHRFGCKWCNSTLCLEGELKVSRGRIPSSHDEKLSRFHKTMAEERTDSVANGSSRHAFRTAFLSCALPKPAEGAGVLTIPGPSAGITARVAPFVHQTPTKSLSIVCSRGLYGYFPARSVALFVNHYVQIGFDIVVLYQYGLSRLSNSDPVVAELIASGRLILIDLRNALQDTYGPFYHDILVYSHSVGQALTNMDCTIRAHKLGARWAFFADPDEFLVWGMNATDLSVSWPNFADSFENVPGLLFSAMSLTSDRFPPLGKREVCNCGNLDWDAFIKLERQRHVDVERHPTNIDHWDCRLPVQHWFECDNFRAIRKLALRINASYDFNPSNVGSHHLHECGQPTSKLSCKEPRRVAIPVSPYDMYLRHYSCLNGPCEGRMPPFWWRDVNKPPPDHLGEHSRGIKFG